MTNSQDNYANLELIHIIVNCGMGSKILKKAKTLGIKGGTILYGKGTVNNALLNFLSLNEEKKEIIIIGTDSHTASEALEKLSNYFKFHKPNHGIAYSTEVVNMLGTKLDIELEEERGEYKPMYNIITTIVERGKAEDVIEAAQLGGSKGGTIINARGSGIHETSRLFHMDIEPEKEIVLILSKVDTTDAIVKSIAEKLEIQKPNNGVIFVQDAKKVYGLFEK